MSGFELMNSRMSNFLHPKLDTSDKWDPTFIGVQRKRHVPPPESEFMREERGKRIRVDMMQHHESNLMQLDSQFIPDTFKGDINLTRFGQGFRRRPASLIASDLARKAEDERMLKMKEEREANYRRHYFEFSHTSPQNPITGRIPEALKTATKIPKEFEVRKRRYLPPSQSLASSIQFSWTDSTAKAAQQACKPAANRRQLRLQREGLQETKKDWSVAQQLSCGDGFVLPRIV